MFGICRLCLKASDNPNINITPDVLKQIEVILPEINMNIVMDPIICQICVDLLEKAYSFKISCLHTEKKLINLMASSPETLNMRDLLNVKNSDDIVLVKQEDIKVEVEEFDNKSIKLDYKPKKIIIKKGSSGYFICTLCDKSFTYELHFLAHVKRHGRDDLKCDYCDKSFIKTESANLSNHVIGYHFQEGINCSFCPMKFQSQLRLKRHLEIHERRFKCDTCGWLFKKKITLNEHLRTHSGERRYQCKICFKSFAQHSTMKIHMKSMHSDERPFQCEICGKSFKLKGNHKQHMLTHSKEPHRYSCIHCGKGYWIRNKLEIHERYHTGERPKVCHICSKSFPSQSSLKRHLAIHADFKPYSCDLCSKTFVQRGNLKIHLKSHRNLNS